MIDAETAGAGAGSDPALVFRVLAFDRLGSTNEEARRQAQAGAAAGTVIRATRQDAGRGRRGRRWDSPEGNLYCSVILRPACSLAAAAQLSLVTAVAAGEAIEACLGGRAQPQLKWPNDVLINGRKVAGILLESDPDPAGGLAWLVVGLGVNVARHPEDTEYPATALAAEGVTDRDAAAVLDIFLPRFDLWYRRWRRDGLAPVRDAWLKRAIGLSLPVTVRLHDGSFTGTFTGLDEEGALVLELAEGGGARRVAAGDVFFPWMSGPAGAARPAPTLSGHL